MIYVDMSNIAPDKPKTLVAFLPSAGFRRPKATLHKFKEIRETVLKDEHGKPLKKDAEAYEYIYVCQDTGAERRWGLVNRFVPSWAKDGN